MNARNLIPAVIGGFVLVPALRAQQPTARWTSDFVVLAGNDTLTSERLTRSPGRLESDFLSRQQRIRVGMVMTTGADGLVSRLETSIRRATDAATAAPLQQVGMTFARDTLTLSMGIETNATGQHLGMAAGTMPFVNLSAAGLEQLLVRAKALGGASTTIPLFAVAGGQMLSATVKWPTADSAIVSIAGSPDVRASVSPAGQLLGAAVPAQNVRFVRSAASTASAPRPIAPPDYSAPAGAPYTAEDVRVRNAKSGVTLAGTLTMPRHANGARVPAVVMITGSGPEDRDEGTPALPGWRPFRQIADTLGRRGIAVLRLDDRGVGGSEMGPLTATSADFADDIRAGLAYLRMRPDIDASKLGLIGHSEGGMIAPMVAATDTTLRGIVLIAGPSRNGRTISDAQVRAAVEAQGHKGAALDSLIALNNVARDAQLAKIPWLKFWFEYDPLPTAARVRSAVLIVQGANDTQITSDQAEELAKAIRSGGNRDVTVAIIPETNHLLVHDANGSFGDYSKLKSLSVNPAVLGAIADWWAARVK
ncbi:MAG: alpha/beta fold hydrolase [Gemmatimonadota bacterium]|nr:alpha/beta fold hydrolase [Gemmatimonadota bacterium]